MEPTDAVATGEYWEVVVQWSYAYFQSAYWSTFPNIISVRSSRFLTIQLL
jgi:hypothetical protein